MVISNVQSRKEYAQASPVEVASKHTDNGGISRKVSQQIATEINSGNKRQRVIAPAASKVIDDEDEPRSSPSLRKISSKSTKQDSKENERRVLSGIENI